MVAAVSAGGRDFMGGNVVHTGLVEAALDPAAAEPNVALPDTVVETREKYRNRRVPGLLRRQLDRIGQGRAGLAAGRALVRLHPRFDVPRAGRKMVAVHRPPFASGERQGQYRTRQPPSRTLR